ncbi:MAG: hypothetical protein MN733_13655 [Nitrososphaera sp.]|nr:hypothetical protein [Nitrososphaera sp.]
MNALEVRENASNEVEIASVLRHHYGDGDLYLPEGTSESVVQKAIALGYLSEDGYLTRKGRDLLAQHEF